MRLWYGGRKFAATALVCWAIHKIYNTCQLIKSLSINFSSALVLDYFSDHILGPSSLINSSHYLPTLIFSPTIRFICTHRWHEASEHSKNTSVHNVYVHALNTTKWTSRCTNCVMNGEGVLEIEVILWLCGLATIGAREDLRTRLSSLPHWSSEYYHIVHSPPTYSLVSQALVQAVQWIWKHYTVNASLDLYTLLYCR